LTGLLSGAPILFASGLFGLVGSSLLARNSSYGPSVAAKPIPMCWLVAAVVQAVASFGHALRGDLPSWASFSLVNATQLLALSLLWLGARRLNGRRVPCWVATLPPAIWLIACLIPGFIVSLHLRLSLYVPLAYGAALWASFDLLAIYRRHGVRAARDMGVLVAVVVVVLLTVVAYTVVAPHVSESAQLLFTGVPALLTALFATTLPFLMLALAREWDAIEEGARHAASLRAWREEMERLHAGLPAVVFRSRVTMERDTVRIERLYRGGDTMAVLGWPPEGVAELESLGPIADYGTVPMVSHVRRTIEDGEHGWEWRVRRQDGSWSWIRTKARRLATLPDGATEVVGYNFNIDREREAEARVMAAARLASLGEMASGLAHEVRQPLQSISLAAEFAQIAIRRGQPDAADDRLERIVDYTQRTSELIDRLRRFARGAEPGTETEPVPLAETVRGTLELVRSVLRDASIGIDVALDDPAPVVRAQAVLLEQVLSNLLLNARDALVACPAGAARRIRITATSSADGMVELKVADTGGGIAPEIMPRLFEPFVTTKGPDNGTGLGLSICHGLVKSMGGSIQAHNDAEGAVFTVTLPAA
jgi:signal transduction histidine kinase